MMIEYGCIRVGRRRLDSFQATGVGFLRFGLVDEVACTVFAGLLSAVTDHWGTFSVHVRIVSGCAHEGIHPRWPDE